MSVSENRGLWSRLEGFRVDDDSASLSLNALRRSVIVTARPRRRARLATLTALTPELLEPAGAQRLSRALLGG